MHAKRIKTHGHKICTQEEEDTIATDRRCNVSLDHYKKKIKDKEKKKMSMTRHDVVK